MQPAGATAHDRWLAARGAVRTFTARRLSPRVAEALLPRLAEEERVPEDPSPPAAADFLTLAGLYPALLETRQRKQRGTWYTPMALAEPTAARTLSPLLASERRDQLRICDPAAGGGTFLVAALRVLRQAGIDPAKAALCLHGIDIDSTAAALAALAVHEECGHGAPDPLAIAANVRTGDALLDLRADCYDAVLGNPPWETLQATPEAAARIAELRPRFHHQGPGKLYTYRLFTERAHQLLRDGGRFGLVLPASLWFDRDAGPLRDLLLEHCDWEWLFGFENRNKLFAIDSRYRFAVVVGSKGGSTQRVKTAFARTDPGDWAALRPSHVDYPTDQLRALSPRHRTFVEVDDARDLALLERMTQCGQPLTGQHGAFAWRQGDFNMTSHRSQFALRSEAEADGYRRGEDGVWRRGDDERLALYQGAMVYDLHPNAGAHRAGIGHATTWETPTDACDHRPQYLVRAAPWRATAGQRPLARIVLRALSNATNERTAVACLLPDVPCGNSLGVLTPRANGPLPLRAMAAGAALLGSLPFDWALRRRLTGTNLNGFVLADCVVPLLDDRTEQELARLALRLCALLPWHRSLWLLAAAEGWIDDPARPAITRSERQDLLTQIDLLAGRAFGLSIDDVAWIARDDGPRGFRRVDRDLLPEQRRPARWLEAAQR